MNQSQDQLYIERVKKGDSPAYAFLVNKYKDMAYTIALKIIGNTGEAQDIAQEGFIKAYQQIGTFKGQSKFSTWLYTIIYRTAINEWKRNRGKTVSIHEPLDEKYFADSTPSAMENLQTQQKQFHIKQAIGRLPPLEALLVTLYYLNENTVKEIGEITDLSGANIKIKLFRARKKLERELAFLLNDK